MRVRDVLAVALVAVAALAIGAGNYERNAAVQLLNVSYDPTRELYQRLKPLIDHPRGVARLDELGAPLPDPIRA